MVAELSFVETVFSSIMHLVETIVKGKEVMLWSEPVRGEFFNSTRESNNPVSRWLKKGWKVPEFLSFYRDSNIS